MKTIMMTTAALVLTAGMASARDHGQRPDFATLDADGSGEITAADLTAMRDARFAEIDTSGDGQVSRAEFLANATAQAVERAGRLFDRMDADGDGLLPQDAIAARSGEGQRGRGLERLIERFDADGSGGLSADEFAQARERIAARGKGRDGGRRN